MSESLAKLVKEIRSCSLCAAHLPLGPRPIIQVSSFAKILVVGQAPGSRVHQTVMAWKDYWPEAIPLPHPSPRNNIWLKRNPWFEEQILPSLKRRVKAVLK